MRLASTKRLDHDLEYRHAAAGCQAAVHSFAKVASRLLYNPGIQHVQPDVTSPDDDLDAESIIRLLCEPPKTDQVWQGSTFRR